VRGDLHYSYNERVVEKKEKENNSDSSESRVAHHTLPIIFTVSPFYFHATITWLQ
jgi:hypothetical protein